MIPKTIHYCWFGGNEMPALNQACMKTWEKHLSDYRIKLWNEENAPMNDFVRYHLERGNWAFVSDYVRLHALYEEGGIYLDTDFEVLKPLDELLDRQGFVAFESGPMITNGAAGSVPGNPFFKACMEYMLDRHNKAMNYQTSPEVTTAVYRSGSYDIDVFPSEYFYPYNPYDARKPVKVLMVSMITEKTYAIHHWAKSWHGSEMAKARGACLLAKKIYARLRRMLKCDWSER